MEENTTNKKAKKKEKIGLYLYMLYGLFMVVGLVVVGRIIYLQYWFDVDSDLEYLFTPTPEKKIIDPQRGAILSDDGKILALSTPMYQVYMDCCILKNEYKSMDKGKELEDTWRAEARDLSDSLAMFYKDKTASEYYNLIISSRESGKRHVKIGTMIDHGQLQEVKTFPLFKKGANRGGIIVEKNDTRQYPYGSLARRVIGYVKDNSKSNGNNKIGIEGKFDEQLHGREGIEWRKKTEGQKFIENFDSTKVTVQNGANIWTTLNIDMQDIADRALRNQIVDDPEIEGACMIVMEVETGAIKAMVNLVRDSTSGRVNESYNWAVGRAGEPGSVFKSVTLMTLLEDQKVKTIEDTIPILNGKFKNYPYDDHIAQFGRDHNTKFIKVREALEISSNQAFCYLAVTNYEKNPKAFMDKIYMYKLAEAFDFDLAGFKSPSIKNPDSPGWSPTDLGVTAYGYGITETPLHILTFYNAIANKGKMVKPYLVRGIESEGKMSDIGPSILNASICSRSTADTLARALRSVVTNGTGKTQLAKAKLPVAGKTGTARVVLEAGVGLPSDPYHDKFGRKQNQGTFVGFFPADNPKYSIISVVYSTLSSRAFYGGTKPAAAVCETVNGIFSLKDVSGEQLIPSGSVPEMRSENASRIILADAETKTNTVPDISGLGLKDAIEVIESSGFKCNFSGVGHVSRQTPAAGASLSKGGTVTITLK